MRTLSKEQCCLECHLLETLKALLKWVPMVCCCWHLNLIVSYSASHVVHDSDPMLSLALFRPSACALLFAYMDVYCCKLHLYYVTCEMAYSDVSRCHHLRIETWRCSTIVITIITIITICCCHTIITLN